MNNAGNASVAESAISVDNNGSVFMTGNFSGTIDFDPGTGVFSLTAAGGLDGYLVKLDNTGNFTLAKRWG